MYKLAECNCDSSFGSKKNQYFRHVQAALAYGKSLCGCNNLQKLAASADDCKYPGCAARYLDGMQASATIPNQNFSYV
jgi:hypothetical protein